MAFSYTNNNFFKKSERETKKTTPCVVAIITKQSRNKFNQGGKRPVLKIYRTLRKVIEKDSNT